MDNYDVETGLCSTLGLEVFGGELDMFCSLLICCQGAIINLTTEDNVLSSTSTIL